MGLYLALVVLVSNQRNKSLGLWIRNLLQSLCQAIAVVGSTAAAIQGSCLAIAWRLKLKAKQSQALKIRSSAKGRWLRSSPAQRPWKQGLSASWTGLLVLLSLDFIYLRSYPQDPEFLGSKLARKLHVRDSLCPGLRERQALIEAQNFDMVRCPNPNAGFDISGCIGSLILSSELTILYVTDGLLQSGAAEKCDIHIQHVWKRSTQHALQTS